MSDDTTAQALAGELSAKIKDAYYHARDNGDTMHTAGDDAARAVLDSGLVVPAAALAELTADLKTGNDAWPELVDRIAEMEAALAERDADAKERLDALSGRHRTVVDLANSWRHRCEAAEGALAERDATITRVRAQAKHLHRARCGDEFTTGRCIGCELLSALDGPP